METRTIFFIGKPGCGKGTQTELLSKVTGWPVFASGKLFRAIAAEDTPVGHKVKAENDVGILAPHWFAMYLYLKSLFSVAEGTSIIFDGFNRKLQEAELVISSLTWLDRPFIVLLMNVSDDEIRRRIKGRGETSGRTDDQVVEERLKEYYEYTEPAIEVFRAAGVLVEINGEQPVEKAAEDIRAALNIQ